MSSWRAKSASARLSSQNEFSRPTHSGLPNKRALRRGLVGAGEGTSEDDYPYLDTHYSNDFRTLTSEELQLSKPKVRPSSPTRLNKPHPDRTFMRWSGNEDELQKERLLSQAEVDAGLSGKGKTQWFSKDFRELTSKDIENEYVMKYMRTLPRMKLSHEVPESTVIGQHTRMHPVAAAQGRPISSAGKKQAPRTGVPVSRSTLQRSLRNASAVPTLEDWLVDAGQEEQQAVLCMMDAAEKSCLTTEARQHMRSGAAPRVEKWMSAANPHERDVAASFLKTLSAKPVASRTGSSSGSKHHRSLSDNSASKHLQPSARHPRRHTEADINAPMLWHLKSDRDPRTGVVNRTSVYATPHRYRGVHYRIHPDWPTYME